MPMPMLMNRPYLLMERSRRERLESPYNGASKVIKFQTWHSGLTRAMVPRS